MRPSRARFAILLPLLASCTAGRQDRSLPPVSPARESAPPSVERPVPTLSEWLERMLKEPTREIDLVEAATVFASHRLGSSCPASAIPRFLEPRLEKVRARLRPSSTPNAKIDALNEELLPAIRRSGATELRWLHETLGADNGECAVNSLLYLIAADQIGLRLEPVVVPTHVLVCHRTPERRRNIETTDRGQQLSSEEYRLALLKDPTTLNALPELPDALDRALAPCTRRQFVAALLCQAGAKSGKGVLREDLEAAARLAPDSYVPLKQLEGYYAARDDNAKWDEFASKAIALAPYLPGLYCARANCRLIVGKFAPAMEDAEASLKLAPNAARFHFTKGLILTRFGQFQEALGPYSRAIAAAPPSAEYLDFRAMALERLKKFDEAIEDCTRAIALDPTKADYYERRARLWAMVGDEEKYEADRKRAKELSRGRLGP
jgi:tetratricopeptide (TPR) repeat protein